MGIRGRGEGPTVGGYYSLDIHLVSLCTNTFSRAQVAGWSSRGAADVERIPKAKTEFPVITTDPHLLSSTSWAGEVQFLTSRRAPRRSAPLSPKPSVRRRGETLQSCKVFCRNGADGSHRCRPGPQPAPRPQPTARRLSTSSLAGGPATLLKSSIYLSFK